MFTPGQAEAAIVRVFQHREKVRRRRYHLGDVVSAVEARRLQRRPKRSRPYDVAVERCARHRCWYIHEVLESSRRPGARLRFWHRETTTRCAQCRQERRRQARQARARAHRQRLALTRRCVVCDGPLDPRRYQDVGPRARMPAVRPAPAGGVTVALTSRHEEEDQVTV